MMNYWIKTILFGILATACLLISLIPYPMIAWLPMVLTIPLFLTFFIRIFWFKTIQEVRE